MLFCELDVPVSMDVSWLTAWTDALFAQHGVAVHVHVV